MKRFFEFTFPILASSIAAREAMPPVPRAEARDKKGARPRGVPPAAAAPPAAPAPKRRG